MKKSNSHVKSLTKFAIIKRLVATVVLISFCFIIILVHSLRQSQVQYEERAAISTRNLALTLEKQLVGSIEKIDIVLLSVSDEFKRQSVHSSINEQELNTFISRLQSRMPELDSLRATDADGNIIYGTGVDPRKITNIADRDYFKLPRNPGAGLVISKPVLGRINGKWNLIFSRSLNHNDGSFAGTVFATITLEQLSKSFGRLDIGRRGSIVLLSNDLGLITRYPEYKNIGKDIGTKNVSPKLQELVKSGQTSGTYSALTGAIAVQRIVSYRKVGNYPFYIVTSRAKSDYLEEWWKYLVQAAGITACFILVTVFSSWLYFKNWEQRADSLAQIEQLAYYDSLTNLPNRRLLNDRLEQALALAKRFNRSMAVIFLDLDHFKNVNDTLGHDVGDELLCIVAERLLGCVRQTDTVCRQGGDEFIIVLTEISQLQDVTTVAEKTITAINQPIHIREHMLEISTSIGIATYPLNGTDAVEIMKKADIAMYETKNRGRNGFSIYQS